MRLKEKKILQKFAAILKKFSAQGAKKVDYGKSIFFVCKNSKAALEEYLEIGEYNMKYFMGYGIL